MPLGNKNFLDELGISLTEKLQQSHAELLQIFEESSTGMSVVSLDGKCIRANKYLCNLFGYSEEELTKLTFSDITHKDDLSIGLDKLKDMLSGKIKNFEIEKRYIHKSGRIIKTLLNSTLIRNLDGSPKYFISQIKDITSITYSMENLKLSEEKFRLVFEKAPIGITHFNVDGKITMVNQCLADMFGSSIEKITKINAIKDITDTKQKRAFEKALQGELGFFEGPYTSITGGKTIYLKAIYAPLFGFDNKVIGGIAITEDITQQKKNEQELISALKEKELLLHEVYHRVKNNLQTVISLINIQVNESKNEEFISELKETKSRLYAMSKVHEVLCQSENLVSISLKKYVKELVSNFDFPGVTYKAVILKDVSLSVNQTTSLGIIINELVTNSIKHNYNQPLDIVLEFLIEKNKHIKFYYSDNGAGITDKSKMSNSGLGMNLVNLLIQDQMDGTIERINGPGYKMLIEFNRTLIK
jgi:PAS domain S-box-containing protein